MPSGPIVDDAPLGDATAVSISRWLHDEETVVHTMGWATILLIALPSRRSMGWKSSCHLAMTACQGRGVASSPPLVNALKA